MQFTDFSALDISQLPSPCFVVDEVAIERNLSLLHSVQQRSGAKILHALKAFSLWHLAPLSNRYLSGICASGLHEALLGKEYYGEVHVFSAAYKKEDLKQLLTFANTIIFNSCSQLVQFESLCREALNSRDDLHFGLRINPEHSEGEVPLYDPCAQGSRLGTTITALEKAFDQSAFEKSFDLITGLHFHTLCEQDVKPLLRTLNAVEQKFGPFLKKMQWLNMGGGHHITYPNYQIDELIDCIKNISERYQLQVILEPGEAVAIGSGVLVAEVLDIIHNDGLQAILDTSATCHMPDTLEMPYRPDIIGAGKAGEKPFTYRLGGLTCLAGDVISDYSFDRPLEIRQRLIFEDMAHYTMVKTTTFNGTALPSIAIWNSKKNTVRVIKNFTYDDFKLRLS